VCPECRQLLVAFQLGGIEIDRCPACRSTWLDAGEMEGILRLAGAGPGPFSEALRAATGRRSRRRCPRCRRRLRGTGVPLPVSGLRPHATIEIDLCPRSHGLWLDPGEMQALVRAFATPGDAPAPPPLPLPAEDETLSGFFAELCRHDLSPALKGN
jgi:Zn-finger nucleic acid-binding protein